MVTKIEHRQVVKAAQKCFDLDKQLRAMEGFNASDPNPPRILARQ